MKKLHFIAMNTVGKFILWFFSVFLVLTILSQISIWAGIKWLNSDSGANWVENQLNIALQDSDYKLQFDEFKYRPLTAIQVDNLKFLDTQGAFAHIQDSQLRVSILSLPMKQLSISLTAPKVELLRLPYLKSDNEKKLEIEPFDFPDIYFNTISISDVKIKNLEISKTITGKKINLSPALSGYLSLSKDKIKLNLQLKPDIEKINTIKELPKTITIKAIYNSQDLIFNLTKMLVKSPLYNMSSSGQASLKADGPLSFITHIESNDLSLFNPELKGTLTSDLKLSGTLNSPKIIADGILDIIKLKENDMKPLVFHAYSNLLSGTKKKMPTFQLLLSSAYKDLPITLKTQVNKDNEFITFNNIKGKATDININGTVNINTDTALMNGNLSADITKLDLYKKLIGQDINGSGKIKILLSDLKQTQKIETESKFKSIQFRDIKIDSFNLKTTSKDVKNIYSTQLSAQLNNLKLKDIILKTLNANITKNNDGGYALKTNGNGQYFKPFSFKAVSDLYNLDNPKLSPRADAINATITMGKDIITASGKINAEQIDFQLETKSLFLTNLPIYLPETLNNLSLSGKVSASGLMNNPIIETTIHLSPLRVTKGGPNVTFFLIGNYNNNLATINLNGHGQGIEKLKGNITSPIKISLNPYLIDLSNNLPVDGKINMAIQTKDILDNFLPPQYDISGFLNSNITINGTANNPQFLGSAELKNGSFAAENLGIKLNNITLSSLLSSDMITLKNLSAIDDKKGTIAAKGQISLDNYNLGKADLNLNLKNFYLSQSDIAEGIFNADINLTGTPSQYNLRGTVKSDHIDITIPEKHIQSIPELNIVEAGEEKKAQGLLKKIALHIEYIANNHIFVRGWGLDAEFGGKVLINGDLANPQFDGQLKSTRGRYEEFGKRFKISKANLKFLGSVSPYPNLDIIAETKVDSITARINLNGSISDPKIDFSSTPSLPDDEILSRILFGRDLSKISPFQAIQLAQTIRRFSGKGGGNRFDPLSSIRKATKFDDLRVETDEEGQANIGVGKYLTDKVYLEFEKGTGEGSSAANLEVEVTPNITLESQIDQNTQAGAGVFWEWEY